MAALVSTPVVAYATTAAWVASPTSSSAGLAWLEVASGDGDARAAAAFRGDRLVIRVGGRVRGIVHQPCMDLPCDAVAAPSALDDGSFAYAVAFPGTGGYVATVNPDAASHVVAEDGTDPHEIRVPHPVASTGAKVVWLDENRIHLAPTTGGSGRLAVRKVDAGGRIQAIAAGRGGIAWIARTDAGGSMIGVRTPAGALSRRAFESDAAKARFAALAIADDGTVVAVRRVADGRALRTEIVAYAVDGTSRLLLAGPSLDPETSSEVPRPSVDGSLAAVTLRSGRDGELDVVWVVDLASGARQRVKQVRRVHARLSQASIEGGRLVYAKDGLAADGGLLRSRIYSARALG